MEQKIVGAWSWTYIEGKGRMVFTADHKLKEGFPPDEEKGRPLRDDDFDYLRSGTWHLEGDILITETDNTPYIAWFDRTFPKDTSEKRPKLEREVKRQKIARIDGEKMVFSDGYSVLPTRSSRHQQETAAARGRYPITWIQSSTQ